MHNSNLDLAAIITPAIDADPLVGTGAQIASLFRPTVADDDGCIDSLRDEDGFLTFV